MVQQSIHIHRLQACILTLIILDTSTAEQGIVNTNLGLLLGTEAPAMAPTIEDFSFLDRQMQNGVCTDHTDSPVHAGNA